MNPPETERTALDAGNANNLALDRTVLANERTYAAWLRTGLAAFATGLGTARFMADTLPLWSVRLIAGLLLLFSAAAFLIAAWRYENLHIGRRHLDVNTIKPYLVTALSVLLASCSLLAMSVLWYLSAP